MSDEFIPGFPGYTEIRMVLSIFENKPKVHIIFPQIGMQSNLKSRTS
jgi:hypothetical protein